MRICDHCGLLALSSPKWQELCLSCNIMFLEADLEELKWIRNQIPKVAL